jgi:hypothetical protein
MARGEVVRDLKSNYRSNLDLKYKSNRQDYISTLMAIEFLTYLGCGTIDRQLSACASRRSESKTITPHTIASFRS